MFHVASQALPKKAVLSETLEDHASVWTPPLQKHLDPTTNAVNHVTVKVRILAGDAEIEYHARFPPGRLRAKDVRRSVAEKQGLSNEAAKLFSLWIVGRDIGG